ncbi:MAG: Calvin cycle protein CP12 [Cyanobacteriota bacterium]|nr:Calvin cycle protein CP12 [Cyanobacteriota bacterium]
MTNNNIEEKIEQEREEARATCDASGANSKECAAAWDSVEELQAEAAHQKEKKSPSSLENYCDDNPDAVECRVYDN